jgi:hypothetical protein
MTFLDLVAILPVVFLFIEMGLNKIRIPFNQIVINILHTLLYFGLTAFAQAVLLGNSALPIYPQNLNWICPDKILYYTYNIDDKKVDFS